MSVFSSPLLHQGGQSDSGMGLSSDNMQTLKRLESLADRRLSIMALKYVHNAPLITCEHAPQMAKATFTVQSQSFSKLSLLGSELAAAVLACSVIPAFRIRQQRVFWTTGRENISLELIR